MIAAFSSLIVSCMNDKIRGPVSGHGLERVSAVSPSDAEVDYAFTFCMTKHGNSPLFHGRNQNRANRRNVDHSCHHFIHPHSAESQ